jgi:hypothetical protein
MCDDLDLDARGIDELTPLPRLGPAMSPLQADYDVALATCMQLRRANAVLQARCDEQAEQIKRLLNERRALAEALKKAKGIK